MTIRFQDKDPSDIVTIVFDFTADSAAIATPQIIVSVASGVDANPTAILVGSPTTTGAIVRQRVQGGIDGVTYSLQCLGYNGADRYSIEALLPVVARPIISSTATKYITPALFEQRFGSELTDLLSNGASFNDAENDAAALIDAYLAASYTLPLSVVPQMVKAWALDITRFNLWSDRAPTEVRQRYDDAMAQLKLIAQGTIALPPGSNGVSANASTIGFGGFSAERIFTSITLAGY